MGLQNTKIFALLLLFYSVDVVSANPLRSSDPGSSNNSASWTVVLGVGLAVSCCLVVAVSLCTCCGESLLNLKGDQPPGSSRLGQRHDSLEPPASIPSTPGSVRAAGDEEHHVTIEPLPDIGNINQRRFAPSASYPRPIGFNQAVNKGISSQDWFAVSCKTPDFPRSQLQYVKEISTGWFGQVVEGLGRITATDFSKRKLAVRILRDDASTMERAYFLYDASLNRDVDHVNVLPLLAKCLDTESYLLIFDLYQTDLKSYLWKSRANSDELIENGTLLHIACQVSAGLCAIHEGGFVYNDLACRNCFISNDGCVKIGDLGVSPQKYKDDYLISGDIAIPIRWLAPESIDVTPDGRVITKEITQTANTWTYGVVLWEILEFAKLPYMDLDTEGVLNSVIKEGSVRLAQPFTPVPHSDHLYEVMRMCWMPSNLRAPMSKINALVSHIYEHRQPMGDFDARWNNLLPGHPAEPAVDPPAENDTASPVPADPTLTFVQPPQIPAIIETSPTEPVPPAPAPRRRNSVESSDQKIIREEQILPEPPMTEFPRTEENVLVERAVDSIQNVPEELKRSDAEVRSFQESETERKEKREFLLSLSDYELAGFGTEELVQFYEFLSVDEIRDLEARHLVLITQRQENLDEQRKLEIFLAMDTEEMIQLPQDELNEYFSFLEPEKRYEIEYRIQQRKDKHKFLLLIRNGDSEQLLQLTAEDLDRAVEVLEPGELGELQESIGLAQIRLERKSEADRIRDGNDSVLLGLSEEKLKDLLTELSPEESSALEQRWIDVNGERQKAREEILTAEGLQLYLLSLGGLDQYFCHLNQDEILSVTQRLEEVKRMRKSLLESEREGFVDLADENLSFWLTEEESGQVRERIQGAEDQEKRRQEILSVDGMEQYMMYKERWDEFFPILTIEERAGIQEKMNLIEEERRRASDMTDIQLGDMRPEDIEFLSQYFDNSEFDRLRIRWEEARTRREQNRLQLLTCDDAVLLRLSESEGGLEAYQAILSDEEWSTVLQRAQSGRARRNAARDKFLDAPTEGLWRLSETDIQEARISLLPEEAEKFDERYLESVRIREEKRRQLIEADDNSLLEMFDGWQGLDAYKDYLTEQELIEVTQRYEKLKLAVEGARDRFLNIPDCDLWKLSQADIEEGRMSLSSSDFLIFQGRLDTAIAERKRMQEELANLTDFEFIKLETEVERLSEYSKFLSENEYETVKEKMLRLKAESNEILNATSAELALGLHGNRERWSQLFDAETVSELKMKQDEAREAREGILSLPEEDLIKFPPGRLENYYRYLTDEERSVIESKVQACLERKKSALELTTDNLKALTEAELEQIYMLLEDDEIEEMKQRIAKATVEQDVQHHLITDEIGEAISPIPGRAEKFQKNVLQDEERKSTSTPESLEQQKALRYRRIASVSLEPLDVDLNEARIIPDDVPIPVSTPVLKQEYDENRERILNRSDVELKKIPLAEIENSYKFLAPEEIFTLQERVRKLQQIDGDWTASDPFSVSERSLSVRSSLRKRRPLISELSQQSKSFLSNMSSVSVFFLDDNINEMNPLEARDLLLNAEDEVLMMLPAESLSEYYNYLTIEEIQDTQHRLTEARDLKRAELLGATAEELRRIEPKKLDVFLTCLPDTEVMRIREMLTEEEENEGISEERPPSSMPTEESADLEDLLRENDMAELMKTAANSTMSSGPQTAVISEVTEEQKEIQQPENSFSPDDFEQLDDISPDFLDNIEEPTNGIVSEPDDDEPRGGNLGPEQSELLLDFGFPGSDSGPNQIEIRQLSSDDRYSPESNTTDLLGIGDPVTLSTPTAKTGDLLEASGETSYHTAYQDLLGDFDTLQTSTTTIADEHTPKSGDRKKSGDSADLLSEILGDKLDNVEEILTSTFTPVKRDGDV